VSKREREIREERGEREKIPVREETFRVLFPVAKLEVENYE
jgi:hypothetical protein